MFQELVLELALQELLVLVQERFVLLGNRVFACVCGGALVCLRGVGPLVYCSSIGKRWLVDLLPFYLGMNPLVCRKVFCLGFLLVGEGSCLRRVLFRKLLGVLRVFPSKLFSLLGVLRILGKLELVLYFLLAEAAEAYFQEPRLERMKMQPTLRLL